MGGLPPLIAHICAWITDPQKKLKFLCLHNSSGAYYVIDCSPQNQSDSCVPEKWITMGAVLVHDSHALSCGIYSQPLGIKNHNCCSPIEACYGITNIFLFLKKDFYLETEVSFPKSKEKLRYFLSTKMLEMPLLTGY